MADLLSLRVFAGFDLCRATAVEVQISCSCGLSVGTQLHKRWSLVRAAQSEISPIYHLALCWWKLPRHFPIHLIDSMPAEAKVSVFS